VALELLSPRVLNVLQAESLVHIRNMQAQGTLITERNVVYVVAMK